MVRRHVGDAWERELIVDTYVFIYLCYGKLGDPKAVEGERWSLRLVKLGRVQQEGLLETPSCERVASASTRVYRSVAPGFLLMQSGEGRSLSDPEAGGGNCWVTGLLADGKRPKSNRKYG